MMVRCEAWAIRRSELGAGWQVGVEKSVVFFYTMSELSDKETEKTIPFTIALKKNTHLE